MTLWTFYFQIFDQAVAKEQGVEFLANLVPQLAGPMLIVWDRLPAHRSRLGADFVRHLDPELNPVEYL